MKQIIFTKSLFILSLLILTFQRVHSSPIVYDTVTELVIVFFNGTEKYYNLTNNPMIVFSDDSVSITTDTSQSVYYHKEITKYYHQKRIAATHIDSTICESSLPFTWNGIIFTASGTQVLPLSSSSGRDSLVYLTVNVHETTYSQTRDTVIENNLPYTFNERTYNINDLTDLSPRMSYVSDTLMLTNFVGCDSVIFLYLYVLNNITVQLTDTICQNELPIVWNGITFSQAGTGSTTLTCSNGTDSTLIMTLVSLPSSSEEVNIAIPENQLPFLFAGRLYNSSVLDTIFLTNAQGCDSVIYLNLFVYNNQTVLLDSTVCENSLPIIWNDSVFYSAGMKQSVLQGQNGADSIIVMQLTVIPTVYTSFQETILENQLPYTVHGKTYYINDFTSHMLFDTLFFTSQTGCDSILYLSLSYIPNVNIEIDSTVCESMLPIIWNGLTFSSACTQQLTLQANSGADSIITMSLHVIPTTYGYFTDTVTESELPYIFMGRQYSQAIANDTFILVSAAGCDSILFFSLIVSVDSTTESISLFQEESIVMLRGNTLVISPNKYRGTILLFSVDGRLLNQYETNPNATLYIKLDNYPAGVYFIHFNNVTCKFNNTTYKFVKI